MDPEYDELNIFFQKEQNEHIQNPQETPF